MTIKISEHIENGHNLYKRTLNKIDSIMSDDYFYNTSSENLIKIGEMSRDFRAWSKVTMNILGQKCNQTEMEELTEKRDMVFYALSNEYRNDYYNRQYGASLKEYIIEGKLSTAKARLLITFSSKDQIKIAKKMFNLSVRECENLVRKIRLGDYLVPEEEYFTYKREGDQIVVRCSDDSLLTSIENFLKELEK